MARSREHETKSSAKSSSRLPAETRHGLGVVFLFALALIFTLSFFDLAGLVGQAIARGLTFSLGWVGYAMPVILLLVGFHVLRSGRILTLMQGVGLVILASGITGLLHSVLERGDWQTAAAAGAGGGYLGYLALFILAQVVGLWGAIVLLIALSLGGILVLFETSLAVLGANLLKLKTLVPSWELPTVNIADRLPGFKTREVSLGVPPAEPPFESVPAQKSSRPHQPPLIAIKSQRYRKVELPLDLLETRTSQPTSGDIKANQETIQRTLQNFGIEVEMGTVNVGPTVTQYTLKPSEGVKIASITGLSNDLALALAAHPIRIEAPIPGQSLVGIEVPNQTVATVSLREVLASEAFQKRRSNLSFALGKDVAGNPWVADIARMPHLLIAGATGSGKSVCINSLLISLLYANSPNELKFIIVDPKRVELGAYNDIPYLLTPVITDVNKTINALKWVVGEMDRRYQLLQQAGKRNIEAYNQGRAEVMPYLLVVVDELADLMAVAATEVETAIIRLAQMARAVGIHLVLATQRPSVDVITGLIKANITSRIAFAVASATDSRTILDTGGAEKLLGRGDCLFISAELSKPKRLQGTLVVDAEIERVTTFLKEQAKPDYNTEVVAKPGRGGMVGGSFDDSEDELLAEARDLVIRSQKASASFLQRRLRVGYARAARLLDLLEEQGVIGPGEGAKPREVRVARGAASPLGQEEPAELNEYGLADDDIPPAKDGPVEEDNEGQFS